jgi:thymidylate kinase
MTRSAKGTHRRERRRVAASSHQHTNPPAIAHRPGYSLADLDVPGIIEAAAMRRVLVVGSMPPAGRDWDLLVDDRDRNAIEAQLRAAGFLAVQGRWVRRSGERPEVIELIRPMDWQLPEAEAERLFVDAVPLAQHERLCVPGPADRLLILARKLPRTPGYLEPKHRERIRSTLEDDAHAFAQARTRATAWGLGGKLRALESRFLRPERARPRPSFLRRPRRGAIIALSGLDGVGKSTQTKALAGSLAALGYDVGVVWMPIGQSEALRRFASTIKHALSRLPVGPLAGARGEEAESHILSRTEPGTPEFGPATRLASHVWATVTTLANAVAFRRAARGTRTRGRIVIFDRYVLDTVVELRFRYAPDGRMPIQERLVRALTPNPARAYLLDLSPEIAHQRKPDWSLEQTRIRARLYGRAHAELSVRRVDAAGPVEDIADQILRGVLDSLAG